MSESDRLAPNDVAARDPYRPPGYFEQPAATAALDPWQRLEAAHTLPKFRVSCTALAVVLLLVGTLNSGGVAFMIASVATRPATSPAELALAALFVISVAAYFVFGVGVFIRQVWSAWGAAAVGGLGIAVDLLFREFDVVSTAVNVVILVLALTIIRFARRLKRAGVPLRTTLQGGTIVE